MKRNIKKALERWEQSAKKVIEAVKEAYPIGTRLLIRKGRYQIFVEVRDHRDAWWHNPGELIGVNLRTGVTHIFSPGHIVDKNAL